MVTGVTGLLLPVRLVVYGSDYDEQDRPSAEIEAYYPDTDSDFDGIGWEDIWEAVRRQYPTSSPQRRATEGEYQAIKESIATFGVLQPAVEDESGEVLAGHLRKRACQELGVHCPVQVISGLSQDQKDQLAFELDFSRGHLSLTDKRRAAEFVLKAGPGNTDRMIGRACGLEHKTVGVIRDALKQRGEIPQVESRQGADGKTYKFPRIIANTPKELETAQRVIKDLPDSCAGKSLDIITASRRASCTFRNLLAKAYNRPLKDIFSVGGGSELYNGYAGGQEPAPQTRGRVTTRPRRAQEPALPLSHLPALLSAWFSHRVGGLDRRSAPRLFLLLQGALFRLQR